MRKHRHDLTNRASTAREDPGNVLFERNVVDQIANLEIVRAVENQRDAICEFSDVGIVHIGDDRFDRHFGVDSSKSSSGGNNFGQVIGHILFIEQNLTLQITEFDEVSIDNTNMPHASSDHRVGQNAAQCSAAHQQDSTVGEFLLSLFADSGEQHLLVVSGSCHESWLPCSVVG